MYTKGFVFIKAVLRRGSLLLLCLGIAGIAKAGDARLHLVVEGVHHSQGHIIVGLFACKASYDQGEKPRFHVLLPVAQNQASVKYTFEDLTPGTFALKLFHDINDNQVLDTNWLGIPREPYGFSNNPRVRFGPPDFAATHFKIEAGKTHKQTVVLK